LNDAVAAHRLDASALVADQVVFEAATLSTTVASFEIAVVALFGAEHGAVPANGQAHGAAWTGPARHRLAHFVATRARLRGFALLTRCHHSIATDHEVDAFAARLDTGPIALECTRWTAAVAGKPVAIVANLFPCERTITAHGYEDTGFVVCATVVRLGLETICGTTVAAAVIAVVALFHEFTKAIPAGVKRLNQLLRGLFRFHR
jgi:intracellular sulfur oxidation DsrE/DsrF family protein